MSIKKNTPTPVTGNDYDATERYLNITRASLSKGKDSRSRDLAQIFNFIVQQALCFCNKRQDLADYVQSAFVQIVAAYDKFDAGKRRKFSTFAGPWIRKGLQKMLRKSIMVPLSVHDMECRTTISRLSLDFEQENNRKPNLEELMVLIRASKSKNLQNITPQKVKFLIDYTPNTASINTPLGDAPDSPTLADRLVAPPPFPQK